MCVCVFVLERCLDGYIRAPLRQWAIRGSVCRAAGFLATCNVRTTREPLCMQTCRSDITSRPIPLFRVKPRPQHKDDTTSTICLQSTLPVPFPRSRWEWSKPYWKATLCPPSSLAPPVARSWPACWRFTPTTRCETTSSSQISRYETMIINIIIIIIIYVTRC